MGSRFANTNRIDTVIISEKIIDSLTAVERTDDIEKISHVCRDLEFASQMQRQNCDGPFTIAIDRAQQGNLILTIIPSSGEKLTIDLAATKIQEIAGTYRNLVAGYAKAETIILSSGMVPTAQQNDMISRMKYAKSAKLNEGVNRLVDALAPGVTVSRETSSQLLRLISLVTLCNCQKAAPRVKVESARVGPPTAAMLVA